MNPKNKRILCLQHASIFENFGGVEYYIDDFLKCISELLGKENTHTLIPERLKSLQLNSRNYEIHKVALEKNTLYKKLTNRYSPLYFKKALSLINELKPTAIICAHVSLGPMAYLLSKITRVPYYLVAYGIESWGSFWPQDALALKKSDGIISISFWTKKILSNNIYSKNPITVIHPALDPLFENLPINKNLKTNKLFTLLSVGRLSAEEKYKGQDHTLKALHQLRLKHPEVNLRYFLQGSGDDSERLKLLCKTLGLEDWVEFKGIFKERSELQKLYEEADIFIMPSRFGKWDGKWKGEGFGIVYVEAASFGVPSIAYDCGGATDIIQNEVSGLLVKPDNEIALADAIYFLYKNPEKVQEMGKKAHEITNQNFTLKNTQAQTKEWLNSL